jgi:hypothetical protein
LIAPGVSTVRVESRESFVMPGQKKATYVPSLVVRHVSEFISLITNGKNPSMIYQPQTRILSINFLPVR